jgi:DNA-binding HxlR family transcriptional regulator
MGASYGQFCPVAKAMELLDERWTLLVIRELMTGSERFNEVRRGVPRMSPTLLSRRLQQLTRAGVIERRTDGDDVRYVLTEAGAELRPVVEARGTWGIRWIGELGDRDLDPKLLLWDMHRHIDREAMPESRVVVHFHFPDAAANARRWWLVVEPGASTADVCDQDPGYPVTLTVTAELRTMVDIWMGSLQWNAAVRTGAVQVDGPTAFRRAFAGWFTLSDFAPVPRPAAAR